MDLYVRVSRIAGRAGDSFISPDLQRDQGASWARSRGIDIDMIHEDLDQSGGKLDRPGLETLMERIRSGMTDGVVVSKLDRLSRLGVADALRLVEDIMDAGGSIAALDLGIDPTTPFGEFGMTIMLALARMERRRLSESWEHAKNRALDRGARMGPTPFGYERDKHGLLQPHPQWGPVATHAFELAASDGVQAALDYLQETVPAYQYDPTDYQPGVRRKRSADHRVWNAFTVRRLLRNRTYLGETHYGERIIRDSHPALVDRETYERAHPGEERPQRAAAAMYPLSRFATCATCGEVLIGARAGGGHRAYRCRAAVSSWKGQRCPAPTNVLADRIEKYLVEKVKLAYQGGGDSSSSSNAVITSVSDAQAAFEQAEHELQAAEQELERFAADATAAELLGEAAWAAGLRSRAQRADAAREAYREQTEAVRSTDITIPAVDLLSDLTPEELGPVLRSVFDAVIIKRGRGPLNERVTLRFHGEANATMTPLKNTAESQL